MRDVRGSIWKVGLINNLTGFIPLCLVIFSFSLSLFICCVLTSFFVLSTNPFCQPIWRILPLVGLLSDNSGLVCSGSGAETEETEPTVEDLEYFEELAEHV